MTMASRGIHLGHSLTVEIAVLSYHPLKPTWRNHQLACAEHPAACSCHTTKTKTAWFPAASSVEWSIRSILHATSPTSSGMWVGENRAGCEHLHFHLGGHEAIWHAIFSRNGHLHSMCLTNWIGVDDCIIKHYGQPKPKILAAGGIIVYGSLRK